jgi:hypothetical protein
VDVDRPPAHTWRRRAATRRLDILVQLSTYSI